MNSSKVVYYPVDENGHFFNFILRKRPPSPDSQLLKYEDSIKSVSNKVNRFIIFFNSIHNNKGPIVTGKV